MITLSKGCDPVRAEVSFNGANPSYVRFVSERVERIELSSSDWKSEVIPLYDTRKTKVAINRNDFLTFSPLTSFEWKIR